MAAEETPQQAPLGSGRAAGEPDVPRRLRLSSILIELGACADPRPVPVPEPEIPPGTSKKQRRKLRRRFKNHEKSSITLGEVVDRTAHAGFGFLAAFLAMVSLPFVGLSTPFGLAIMFIGLQMAAGRNKPWLPARLRRHVLAMSTLDWLSHKLARWTRGVERFIRPRWTLLTRGPFWNAIGIGIIVQGLGLALPLPFPGSNWLFVMPIVIYSIGLLEHDGILVATGHAITTGEVLLGAASWEAIRESITRVVGWLA